MIGIYVLMSTLGALAMTIIRASGSAPDTAAPEQAAYFLSMPWGVIIAAWAALALYVAALALIAMRRPGAKRTLGAAVAVDIGGWLWARMTTTYTEVFTPAEQNLDALLFLMLITVIVLMMVERRTETLTYRLGLIHYCPA